MELMRLSHDVEIALFRIAQEAVHNSVRHGQARRVEVRLAHRDGQIEMAIVDNGVGFDPEGVVNGYGLGLNTMRDRASAIGGELSITSKPGRTRVEVRIPFNIADKHYCN
jgi:signal transduction histidine kinase